MPHPQLGGVSKGHTAFVPGCVGVLLLSAATRESPLLPRGYHIYMGYPMSATEGLGAVCNLCMSLMPWPLFQMKWLFMLPQITL